MKRSTVCGNRKAEILLALAEERPMSINDLMDHCPRASMASMYNAVKDLLDRALVSASSTQPTEYRLTAPGELVVDALEVLRLLDHANAVGSTVAVAKCLSRAIRHQRDLIERLAGATNG